MGFAPAVAAVHDSTASLVPWWVNWKSVGVPGAPLPDPLEEPPEELPLDPLEEPLPDPLEDDPLEELPLELPLDELLLVEPLEELLLDPLEEPLLDELAPETLAVESGLLPPPQPRRPTSTAAITVIHDNFSFAVLNV